MVQAPDSEAEMGLRGCSRKRQKTHNFASRGLVPAVSFLEMESSPTQEQVGMRSSVHISKINELVNEAQIVYNKIHEQVWK